MEWVALALTVGTWIVGFLIYKQNDKAHKEEIGELKKERDMYSRNWAKASAEVDNRTWERDHIRGNLKAEIARRKAKDNIKAWRNR